MTVKVTYKSGNDKVLYGVTNEQFEKIQTNSNIIRYEVLEYFNI